MEDIQPLQGPCSYGRCPNLPIVVVPTQVIFFSDICIHIPSNAAKALH